MTNQKGVNIVTFRSDKGVSTIETIVGLSILLAVVGTLAVALAQSTRTSLTASTRSVADDRLDALLEQVAAQPFEDLIATDFVVPNPCDDNVAQSCVDVGSGRLAVSWSVAPAEDPLAAVPAGGIAAESVVITASTTLRDGSDLSRSRTVVSPVFGDANDSSAVVRITLVEDLSAAFDAVPGVAIIDDSGVRLAGPVAFNSNGQAAVRVDPASACTDLTPCRLALNPGSSTPTETAEFTMTAVDGFAASSQLTLTPRTVTDVSVAIRQTASVTVMLAADSDGLPGLTGGFTQRFVHVGPGDNHTCAIDQRSDLYCWGFNARGQLGTGNTTSSSFPVPVDTNLNFASVKAGRTITCGIAAGDLYCWGAGLYVGNGPSTTDVATPTMVLSSVTAFDVGDSRACAIQAFTVHCWGEGDSNLFGGASSPVTSPTSVTSGENFVEIAVGFDFSCARSTANEIFCWGANDYGQLGAGLPTFLLPETSTPRLVAGGDTYTAIDVGLQHACALREGDRNMVCWGRNTAGQLGDGTFTNRTQPTVSSTSAWIHVTAAGSRTCGQLAGLQQTRCWGRNTYGETGSSSTGDANTPQGTSQPVTRVESGLNHSCGFADIGGPSLVLTCWGRNNGGQLGDDNRPVNTSNTHNEVVVITEDPVEGGTEQAYAPGADTTGSICVWASFDDGLQFRTRPFCNDVQADRILIDSYELTVGDPSTRVSLPAGTPVVLSVDRIDAANEPDNPASQPDVEGALVACPHIPSMRVAVDGSFVNAGAGGECTSWTWGHPTHLVLGDVFSEDFVEDDYLPLDTDPTTPDAAWPGITVVNQPETTRNAVVSLIWANGSGGPAEGVGGGAGPLWAKPNDARPCATSATCSSPALSREAFTGACTGPQPIPCSDANVAPRILDPANQAEQMTVSPEGFTFTFDDPEDDPFTVTVVTPPATGTLTYFNADTNTYEAADPGDVIATDAVPTTEFLYSWPSLIPAGTAVGLELSDGTDTVSTCVYFFRVTYASDFAEKGRTTCPGDADADANVTGRSLTVAQAETDPTARSISARLLHVAGGGLPQDEVSFTQVSGPGTLLAAPTTVTTDSSGTATLDLSGVATATAGDYVIEAGHPDIPYDVEIAVTVRPSLDETTFVSSPATATLDQGDSVTLTASADDLAGDPMESLVIRAVTDDPTRSVTPQTATCITDATGSCTVDVTASRTANPPGPVTIGMRSGFVLPTVQRQTVITVNQVPARIDVDGLSVPDEGTGEGTAIVFNGSGQPVAGQTLAITSPGGAAPNVTATTTNGDGEATLSVTNATTIGTYTYDVVVAGAPQTTTQFTVTVTPTTTSFTVSPIVSTTLAQGRSLTLQAQAFDENGNPVVGVAPAVAGSLPNGIAVSGNNGTDTTGSTVITVAADRDATTGPFTLTFSLNGQTASVTITVVAGDRVASMTGSLLSDGSPSGTLTVRLTELSGEPVRGEAITVDSWYDADGTVVPGFTVVAGPPATTNDSGVQHFDVATSNVPVGSYLVRLDLPGATAQFLPFEVTPAVATLSPSTGAQVAQASTGQLPVRVTDAAGNPVSGATVYGRAVPAAAASVSSAVSGPDGIAVLRVGVGDRPAGTLPLQVAADRDFSTPTAAQVEVVQSVGTVTVTGGSIAAGTTGTVTVSVSDRTSVAMGNATVSAVPPATGITASPSHVATNAGGNATLTVRVASGVGPGRYQLGLEVNGRPAVGYVEVA